MALKSSGLVPQQLNLSMARFRMTDSRLGVLEALTIDDRVSVWGQPVSIQDLLSICLSVERNRLLYSLWQLDSFERVKLWLKTMQVLVRFSYDADDQLCGHLLLAETIIPMVETVERRDYVLANGDMASDTITRNYGMRAKVFALDRARRTPRVAVGNSIMDRLSRTLN